MKKNGKIVIVEDEADLRNTLSDLLELSGYEILSAANGREGCTLIIESRPDLVICDINMPEMNGYEVLTTISKRFEADLIPAFLFLSARVQMEDMKRGLKLGADDYITKPFDTSELLKSIELRLQKRKNIIDYASEIGVKQNSHTGNSSLTTIEIPDESGFRYISSRDVIKCVADRAYCVFYLSGGEKIMVSKPMKEFQQILEKRNFIKVHKSYIVNKDHVKSYVRGKGGHLVLSDGSCVAVAVGKKEEVINLLREK